MATHQSNLTSLTRTPNFPLFKLYFSVEILSFFTKAWFLSNSEKFFDFPYLNLNFPPYKSFTKPLPAKVTWTTPILSAAQSLENTYSDSLSDLWLLWVSSTSK